MRVLESRVTGDLPRVLVGFLPEELAELAIATTDLAVRKRLLDALGLLDRETAEALKEAMRP